MYEDPEEFIPERFLGLEPDVMERLDPRKYVFGHGRRCVSHATYSVRCSNTSG